jgi:organic radical activating enzyme
MRNALRGLKLIRMLNWDTGSRLGPLRADISVTSACNYHCVFCGTHSSTVMEIKPVYLRPVVFSGLLEDLKELGTRDLLFSGNGEPFLSNKLVDFIAKNSHFRIKVMTNGSLLDKVDKRLLAKLSGLSISLNSGNGKTHWKTHGYTGANQFLKIVKNIERLLQYDNSQGKIQLNYVVTPDNQNEVADFKVIAKWLGVRYNIRPMDTGFIDGHPATKGKLQPCYMGFIQPTITAEGKVQLCCGGIQYSDNDLNFKRFTDIWQDMDNREMRFSAARGKPLGTQCYGCANAQVSSALFHRIYSRIPILSRGGGKCS